MTSLSMERKTQPTNIYINIYIKTNALGILPSKNKQHL